GLSSHSFGMVIPTGSCATATTGIIMRCGRRRLLRENIRRGTSLRQKNPARASNRPGTAQGGSSVTEPLAKVPTEEDRDEAGPTKASDRTEPCEGSDRGGANTWSSDEGLVCGNWAIFS